MDKYHNYFFRTFLEQNQKWHQTVLDIRHFISYSSYLSLSNLLKLIFFSLFVSSISLNKQNIELELGNQDTLIATFNPIDATNIDIKWTSSNNEVVTVDNFGNIKGINIGESIITATSKASPEIKTSVSVKVTNPIITPTTIDLETIKINEKTYNRFVK